jgi:predicted nucleic acid-binding Zn ribbon protein
MRADEDEAVLDDREDPDPNDMDNSDDPPVVDCPYCGEPTSEEAERCPHCENYISAEDSPRRTKWWVLATAILLLIATMMWLWISGSTNPRPLIP